MPEAMTPREKVAAAIREHIKVDATGLAPAIASAFVVGVDQAADAILTALASGSGDHAELAGELRKHEHRPVGSLRIDMSDVRTILATFAAHDALIAEVAALRGERDRAEGRIRDLAAMFGVCDGGRYLNDWKARCDRATEAERKLAEARGLLGEWLDTMAVAPSGRNAIDIATDTDTFLSSTEAERG